MKKQMTSKTINTLFTGATSVLAVLLLSSTAGAANILINGSFEAPVIASFSEQPAGSTAITGWTIEGTNPADGGVMLLRDGGAFGTTSSDGFQHLSLQSNTFGSPSGKAGIISQTIATTIGDNYSLSFDYSGLFNTGSMTITYDLGGADQTVTFSNPGGPVWAAETFDFVATSTSTTLTIEGDFITTIQGPAIDNVSIVFVPEPSSTALLGLGGLALALRRRRA